MAKDPVSFGVPPKFTRLTGEALWSAVLNRYELEQHELLILREIVRSVDDLDRLANITGRQGAVSANGGIHPALAEARQLRMTLAALIGALRLPDEKEDDQVALRRPRRRPAVRSIDPPPPDTPALVHGNVAHGDVFDGGAAPPRSHAPSVAARRIAPPPQTPGKHFADEQTPRSGRLSVSELLAREQLQQPRGNGGAAQGQMVRPKVCGCGA